MASSSSSPVRAFLELRAGDPEQHADLEARYDATASHLQRVGASYGWEADVKPEDLDDEAREILVGSDTRENFIALLTGSKGVSKSDRSKKLHYGAGCPVHRIESGFVMQSGDVTRGDGSGGEAALGGTIKAEAEGLAITPKYGSLCMASGARKDSITSQFFIVLATEANQLAKLGPKKYVCFGDVLLDQDEPAGAEGAAVLRRVELYGSAKGTPTEPVWIEASGML
ncbi:unnamed protein product [Tilletia laevis]|nr:unnamed protein product [Tilletia caries]CAD6904989.1 unnamed protein product [Tilletia laevis]CAD6985148.1 unnamed protein product [Tilletia controversa]